MKILTLTFTVTDALMSPIGFAILSGAGVIRKATADNDTNIFVHTVFKAPIQDDGTVRIDLETAGDSHDVIVSPDAPVFGTVLDEADAGIEFCTIPETSISLLGHCSDEPTCGYDAPFAEETSCGSDKDTCKHQYSITEAFDLVLNFGAEIGRKYAGRTMMVDCYTIRRSGAMEMLVDAEHFGGNFYVEASTLFRDQATGEDLAAEFIIPNAKIQSNFTFAMSSSGDPSTFDFVMDAFPAYTKFDKTHKCLCALQIIGGDQDVAAEDNVECPEPEAKTYKMIQVVAGYDEDLWEAGAVWTADDIATIQKLGRNFSTAINGSDVDFYGTVLSGADVDGLVPAEDQTGYYVPVDITLNSAAYIAEVDKYGKFHMGETASATTEYQLIKSIDQDVPVNTYAIFPTLGSKVTAAASIAAGEYDVVVEVPEKEVNNETVEAHLEYYDLPANAAPEFYSFDFSALNFR